MHDEEGSAHQFSLNDKSIQADSEERLDCQMAASEVERIDRKDRIKSPMSSK